MTNLGIQLSMELVGPNEGRNQGEVAAVAFLARYSGRLVWTSGPSRTSNDELSHMCYIRSMPEVASRELRNDTRGLLRRVAEGEDIVITVDGQPVAALRRLNQRPRWIPGSDFARRLARRQADPGLRHELRSLAPDTTDDLPL